MQYRQDIATLTPIVRVELITLDSNHTKYLAQLCGQLFLRFGIFLTQICESCGATYRRNYEMFSAL